MLSKIIKIAEEAGKVALGVGAGIWLGNFLTKKFPV